MLTAWVAWIARVETYMEHLERVLAVRTDPDLVLALQDSDEPMVSMDTLGGRSHRPTSHSWMG